MGSPAEVGDAAHQKAKVQSEMLWTVTNAIAGVPKPKLKEALELNERMFGDKDSPFQLRHTIADGLLHGRLPPCPWCGCKALEQEGGQIKCAGFVDGSTPCAFKQAAAPPLPAIATSTIAGSPYQDSTSY